MRTHINNNNSLNNFLDNLNNQIMNFNRNSVLNNSNENISVDLSYAFFQYDLSTNYTSPV